MKVVKDLSGFANARAVMGNQKIFGAKFILPPLMPAHYYKVTGVNVILRNAVALPSSFIKRDDTEVFIVSDKWTDSSILNNEINFVKSQGYVLVGFNVQGFEGAGGASVNASMISEMHNPYIGFTPIDQTELDFVAAGAGLGVVVNAGDLYLGSIIDAWISYDVVQLTDSERIQLLQRCECTVVGE